MVVRGPGGEPGRSGRVDPSRPVGRPRSVGESWPEGGSRPEGRSWLVGTAAAVVIRPRLWATALRQVLRLAPSGWWRRWPPLPVPDADYLRFRIQTQYGDPDRHPDPADVVAYLRWCRRCAGRRRVG